MILHYIPAAFVVLELNDDDDGDDAISRESLLSKVSCLQKLTT